MLEVDGVRLRAVRVRGGDLGRGFQAEQLVDSLLGLDAVLDRRQRVHQDRPVDFVRLAAVLRERAAGVLDKLLLEFCKNFADNLRRGRNGIRARIGISDMKDDYSDQKLSELIGELKQHASDLDKVRDGMRDAGLKVLSIDGTQTLETGKEFVGNFVTNAQTALKRATRKKKKAKK